MMNKLIVFKYYLILSGLLLLISCGSTPTVKEKSTPQPIQKKITAITTKSTTLSTLDLDKYEQAKGYIVSNQHKPAREILTRLRQNNPNHIGILLNLASCEYQLKNYSSAQHILDIPVFKTQKNAHFYNLQGLLNIEQKQFNRALTHYQQALALDNTLYNAHYNLALLYDIYFQDIPKAYKHYQRYLALTPIEDETTKSWLEQLKHSL